jgi:hypothetical protein
MAMGGNDHIRKSLWLSLNIPRPWRQIIVSIVTATRS